MESKSSPLVSVYIPTHNRAELVCKAVESVLMQTYANVEVVVCVDGSTDDTVERLKDIIRIDHRLRMVVNSQAKGANASRNSALAVARGDFVTGLDDDDEFLPHRVASFLKAWELLTVAGENPVFLFAQDIFSDGLNRVVTRKPSRPSLDDLCVRNVIGNQVFLKKETMRAVGFYDEDLPAWQDLDLWMRLTRNFGSGHLVDVASLHFNDDDRPDRITKSNPSKIKRACDLILSKSFYLSNSSRQNIYLQYLSPYYGFPFGVVDLFRAYQLNPGVRSLWRLLKLIKERLWD